MFVFNVTTNADLTEFRDDIKSMKDSLSALEKQMGEVQDKLAEIRNTITAEAAEVGEAIAALEQRIEQLSEQIQSDAADKETLLTELDGIKDDISGIFQKSVHAEGLKPATGNLRPAGPTPGELTPPLGG